MNDKNDDATIEEARDCYRRGLCCTHVSDLCDIATRRGEERDVQRKRFDHMKWWGRYLAWGYVVAPFKGRETMGVRCHDEGYYKQGGVSALYKDHGWNMEFPIPDEVRLRTENAAIDAAIEATANDPEYPRNEGWLMGVMQERDALAEENQKLIASIKKHNKECCPDIYLPGEE